MPTAKEALSNNLDQWPRALMVFVKQHYFWLMLSLFIAISLLTLLPPVVLPRMNLRARRGCARAADPVACQENLEIDMLQISACFTIISLGLAWLVDQFSKILTHPLPEV